MPLDFDVVLDAVPDLFVILPHAAQPRLRRFNDKLNIRRFRIPFAVVVGVTVNLAESGTLIWQLT